MNLTWSFWIRVSRWPEGDSFHSILLGGVAELLGDVGGDVDVEAAHLAVGVLQAEAGLVELRADDDAVLVATATAAAGRDRERQCDGQCDGACDAQ